MATIRLRHAVLAAVITAALAACATLPPALGGGQQASAERFNVGQAQQVQQVELGTIISMRPVTIHPDGSTTAIASVGGAAVGGLAGQAIGAGKGRTAATIAIALAGAVAGNKVGDAAGKSAGLEVTIKLDAGRVVAVTQAADVDLKVGQRVQLIGGSGYGSNPTRVVPL